MENKYVYRQGVRHIEREPVDTVEAGGERGGTKGEKDFAR